MNLPRAKDATRPRSASSIFLLEGFERLTSALRRGDPFESLDDLITLRNRYSAFCRALEDRLRLQGMDELLEEDDEHGE